MVNPIRITLVLLAGLFGGCASTSIAAGAEELDVVLVVRDETAPSDGRNICVFEVRVDDVVVEELVEATVECNSVPLKFSSRFAGFAERIPVQAVGGLYEFAHEYDGVRTTVALTVPARPSFQGLVAGATIQRAAATSVLYDGGAGGEIRVLAFDRDSSVTGGFRSNTGSYDELDTTSLEPGPGRLRIERRTESDVSSTGFRSVRRRYGQATELDVVWN